MSDLLNSLKWRYATKKYDATRKVSEADLATIKEAIRLSVSSMGLQPYKIMVIENPEIREKLKAAAYNQTPITEASQLFVFANEVNVGEKQIEGYLTNIAQERQIPKESLQGFSDMLYGAINGFSEEGRNTWTAKQTYIALSTLIAATATLQIDATPMEGFNAAQFNEILGLDQLGLNAAVIATIGYRHEEDATQHFKKVRKSHDDLFITL
ncbi:NAD(P)H-dependent oxidoreductase [Flavobacterium kingsejongi]|uniref:NAD(P)H-dependent oxidoreductase n=1 Tax=Flavobacterium kingsejongi TaxID=1678728 RepID=A0A2S1LSX8_9FLAO|nr:NAD(P)H-dependent oxidoreductase [Flavobacterium kingsejongi]AWG26782.1 NAD(P)H-dependent oxidoreductase [Flavobacterium kingsejongi]